MTPIHVSLQPASRATRVLDTRDAKLVHKPNESHQREHASYAALRRHVSLKVGGRVASFGVCCAWLMVIAVVAGGSAVAQELDLQFAPNFNGIVETVSRQADGTIIVGGEFSQVNGQSRYGLARLRADGVLLAAFPDGPNNVVRTTAVDSSGRILLGGSFDHMGLTPTYNVARLQPDGTLDTSFLSGLVNSGTGEVRWLAVLPNGKIVVTGALITAAGPTRIALLNADGSVNSGFNPPDLDDINTMVVTAENQILIAGSFDEQFPDCIFNCVIRLNLDGSIDSSFSMTSVKPVHMSLQANGRILATGNFSKIDNHLTYNFGRMMPNGGPDTSFSNIESRYASMSRIQEQADGTILIAGSFRWETAGASFNRIARLLSSGARDTSFNEPLFGSIIYAVSVSESLDFVVGGQFLNVNSSGRNRLARFYTERPDPIYANGFD